MTELCCRIYGRVQGVGFRYYTRLRAQQLDLTGWVRNERDSSVSLRAQGPEESLRQLEKWLHKGPPGARVDRVKSEWIDPVDEYRQFAITY